MSGSIKEHVMASLDADERYRQVLSGAGEDSAARRIDETVRTLVIDLASGLDQFIESLDDPNVRARFLSSLKERR